VREQAPDVTPLVPAISGDGAARNADWRLCINADVEAEA